MKKDKLFDLIHDFIYYGLNGLGPDRAPGGEKLDEDQLVEAGIDINELWESVDWFLEKIAEKYRED